MKAKLRLYHKAVLLVFLFLSGLLIAGAVFPALNKLFAPSRAKCLRDAIKLRWLKEFGAILNLKVERQGNVSGQPVFLVCNHISWLDIIVLGQFVPGCFVAKNDISSWPVIGFLSKQAGTVFIQRGDKKQILKTAEKMAWQFRQHGNIIAFPEGTTTSGGAVLDFHASLFQPALLTKSAIQPAALCYRGAAAATAPFVGDDDFVPHLLQMLRLERIDVGLVFLPVIDSTGKHRNAASTEARLQIAQAIVQDASAISEFTLEHKINHVG